jgi:hypothetical protein
VSGPLYPETSVSVPRHALWRIVERKHSALQEIAPDGYTAAAEVFLVGRAEPIEIRFVETNSQDDDPWIWLEAVSSGREKTGDHGENAAVGDFYVLVNESSVARVEFRFKRGDRRSIGFADSAYTSPDAGSA